MKSLCLIGLLALISFPAESDAAFDGKKVQVLVKALNEFAKAGCENGKIESVNEAIGLLNGSVMGIKDEKIRAAHADQLRDALGGVRPALMDAILGGRASPDCPKKIREGIKKIQALPIAGSASPAEGEPAKLSEESAD